MKFLAGLIVGIMLAVCLGGAALVMGLPPFGAAGAPLSLTAASSNTNPALNVTLSENYLNQLVAENLPREGALSNVALDLHPGNLVAITGALAIAEFVTLHPTVTVRVSPTNHRIVIQVERIALGGVEVPPGVVEPQIAQIKTNLEQELNSQLQALRATTGLQLATLTTAEDAINLGFTR